MNNYLALVLGVFCAGIGGELFVRGIIGVARWAWIAPGIVAVTLAAFATSGPEFSVGIFSAVTGTPQLSLGNVLGANVVNVSLVLGIVLAIGGIRASRAELKREFPAALLVPFVIGALAFDGVVSRFDGMILMAIFVGWLLAVALEARRQRSTVAEASGERQHWLSLVFGVAGLALLIAAGRLILSGASGIAKAWGIGAFVVGALIVAVGTTVPELATAVIAKLRRHDEVSLGTILGSNIFNSLWIVGVVAVICPVAVSFREVAPVLLFGVITVALTWPTREGIIRRYRGVLLLALYALYVVVTL